MTSQLRKQKQEDFKFKFNLGHIARPCVKLMMITMVITIRIL